MKWTVTSYNKLGTSNEEGVGICWAICEKLLSTKVCGETASNK